MRRFWRGERKVIGDLGYRLTGSSDVFSGEARPPQASLNFVTVHDGFTLRDLVSYEKKHNEANGEDNADGGPEGTSQNCGVEGETDDARVVASAPDARPQPDGDALRVPGRPDARDGRRAMADAARQQQRLLP